MACEENKFAVRVLQHLKPLKKLRCLASFILQKTCRRGNLGWRNPTNILSCIGISLGVVAMLTVRLSKCKAVESQEGCGFWAVSAHLSSARREASLAF